MSTTLHLHVRRRAVATTVALVAALVLSAVAAPRADAAAGDYPYTDCVWQQDTIAVFVDDAFPGDVVRAGELNSFRARVRDAARQWNRAFELMDDRRRLVVIDRDRRRGEHGIFIRYRDIQAAGTTYSYGCDYQSDGLDRKHRVTIDIDRRGVWFTQGDHRRATWERCDDPQYTWDSGYEYDLFHQRNSYACSKLIDFGSVVTHELGHALGLQHPGNASSVGATYGNRQYQQADCHDLATTTSPWWNLRQSTLCTYTFPHHTEMRTLSAWDRAALRVHHTRPGRHRPS